MKAFSIQPSRRLSFCCALLLLLDAPILVVAEPSPAAVTAFNTYSAAVEHRLLDQHRATHAFLAPCGTGAEAKLRRGDLIVEPIQPVPEVEGALLHHWRGTAFAPGARAADFPRLMRDFDHYPQFFAPQVVTAHALQQEGERVRARMRIRQRHVITVVLDTEYEIQFGHIDSEHGYSISHSTRIAEIASPGTNAEHPLNARDDHGFLWRLNTYWSYEERDGGLYLQIEAISLTRSIPAGLGWVIGPYIDSIPRESLEFTLRSAANALRRDANTADHPSRGAALWQALPAVKDLARYSARSASMGSIEAARRAGIQAAARPQAASKTQTETIVAGSCSPTPKRNDFIAWVAIHDPKRPHARPRPSSRPA
jgi:hypothetical protein